MEKDLSIVIPLYNEASIISVLLEDLQSVLEATNFSFEVILVDDGSNDHSRLILREMIGKFSWLRVLNLSRNFGQHAAINAGLQSAEGNMIVVMDGDLQDSPETILKLVKELNSGFDMVLVDRTNRKVSRLYSISQRLFYYILNLLSDLQFDPRFGNFSIINRKVLEAYLTLNGAIVYYPAALRWLGFKFSTITSEQQNRSTGSKSKYSLKKRLNLAGSIILSHSIKPLRVSIVIGIFISLTGFLAILFFMYLYLKGSITDTGWPSVIISIYFFSGVQLSCLGVYGLYLGSIYEKIQKKPIYIIDLP